MEHASGPEEVTNEVEVAEREVGDSLSGCFSLGVMERIKSWGVM